MNDPVRRALFLREIGIDEWQARDRAAASAGGDFIVAPAAAEAAAFAASQAEAGYAAAAVPPQGGAGYVPAAVPPQGEAGYAAAAVPPQAEAGHAASAAAVPPSFAPPASVPSPAAQAAHPQSAPDRAATVPSAATPEARRARIAAFDWDALAAEVAGCTACGLCKTRKHTVFGVGSREARWMLVGEAPGAEEDARGEPFVGQAGRLLDSMLAASGLARARDVFIANVLKCRPPGNRDPQPQEVAACEPFLMRQLELVAPDIVMVLGRFAAQSLLATDASIARLRGRVHGIEVAGRRIPVVVTYHPAYLLRTPGDKAKSWADWCLAASTIGAAA